MCISSITLIALSNIVTQLDVAYRVEYQLLQTSEYSLTRFDKVKETLGNAATMGEEDLLETANKYAQEAREKLQQNIQSDQDNSIFLQSLLSDFNDYYQLALRFQKRWLMVLLILQHWANVVRKCQLNYLVYKAN